MQKQKITLLYVEDDPVARDVLSQMIPMKFPELTLFMAENGKTGLELYREHAPDIVITDINMPVMDGIRMAGEIKAANPEAVIIVVTAYSDSGYLMDAIEIGISHYLLKPIDYKQLFAMIQRCVAAILLDHRLRDQNAHIRKLSRAVEQSPNMVMITDADGAIEYVNPKFTEVTGYSPDEITGKRPWRLDDAAEEFCVELKSAVAASREWRGEFPNRKKDGGLYWESASISPLSDEQGQVTHFVTVREDISLRKAAEAEIEILNAHLAVRARELEEANHELEAFSHTVSHDLRTPLSAIFGFSEVLLTLCAGQLDEQSTDYVQQISNAAKRMDQLITTLLTFSRLSRATMAMEDVSLTHVANDVAMGLLMRSPLRQVTFAIAEGVMCRGDAALLRIALENLLGNAWKYTSRRKEAVIEFGTIEHAGKPAYFVRDNGAGFDIQAAAKLFTPFQRLHDRREYDGHGIGLATVKRIIQRHGGGVWGEGEADKGATFYFTLPQGS